MCFLANELDFLIFCFLIPEEEWPFLVINRRLGVFWKTFWSRPSIQSNQTYFNANFFPFFEILFHHSGRVLPSETWFKCFWIFRNVKALCKLDDDIQLNSSVHKTDDLCIRSSPWHICALLKSESDAVGVSFITKIPVPGTKCQFLLLD